MSKPGPYTPTSIFDNLCCREGEHNLGKGCEAAAHIRGLEKQIDGLFKVIRRAEQDFAEIDPATCRRQADAARKRMSKAQGV